MIRRKGEIVQKPGLGRGKKRSMDQKCEGIANRGCHIMSNGDPVGDTQIGELTTSNVTCTNNGRQSLSQLPSTTTTLATSSSAPTTPSENVDQDVPKTPKAPIRHLFDKDDDYEEENYLRCGLFVPSLFNSSSCQDQDGLSSCDSNYDSNYSYASPPACGTLPCSSLPESTFPPFLCSNFEEYGSNGNANAARLSSKLSLPSLPHLSRTKTNSRHSHISEIDPSTSRGGSARSKAFIRPRARPIEQRYVEDAATPDMMFTTPECMYSYSFQRLNLNERNEEDLKIQTEKTNSKESSSSTDYSQSKLSSTLNQSSRSTALQRIASRTTLNQGSCSANDHKILPGISNNQETNSYLSTTANAIAFPVLEDEDDELSPSSNDLSIRERDSDGSHITCRIKPRSCISGLIIRSNARLGFD